MRTLLFIVFCAAALWLVDMFFYKSRYSNQIWFETKYEAEKIGGQVRRWTRF
jgi:lysylphosphatidylglycerol synthetase-like protein (DUF2156 family)